MIIEIIILIVGMLASWYFGYTTGWIVGFNDYLKKFSQYKNIF